MSKFKNDRKDAFVQGIPKKELATHADQLSLRCKFNFYYFVPDIPGQDWSEWGVEGLSKLLKKLQNYSENTLGYWENQRVGREHRMLSFYPEFPLNTEFVRPVSVPHDVRWGRFRIDQSSRLVGFTVPSDQNDHVHAGTNRRFCSNTFYVVFLDRDHKFWISEPR